MNKKLLLFLVAGAIFMVSALQIWRGHDDGEISFVKGEGRYVIDTKTGEVSLASPDGPVVEVLGSPAAGNDETAAPPPIPRSIINYYLIRNGSITGQVWEDLNGNLQIDAGEPGMPDISVFVDMDDSTTFTPGDPVVKTDINGTYMFHRIKSGSRNVYIDPDTVPSNYGVATSQPLSLNLIKNQKLGDVDFALQTKPGKVTGTLWDQTDSVPMSGVMVYVDRDNNRQFSTGDPNGMTNNAGTYQITGIPVGNYNLFVNDSTLDVKYHHTPIAGALPTPISVAPNSSQSIDLTYLHKATICGILLDTSGRAWANITVFIDQNNNGTHEADDPSVVTDAAGKYCFDQLYPGTYSLLLDKSQLPAGYDLLLLPGMITVGAGEDSSANFTTYQPVTISGLVWNDASGNRVAEIAEIGLPDITVFLDNNNNGVVDDGEKTTRTDGSGSFTFTGLEGGASYIRIDETGLSKEYIRTTTANPLIITLEPGQVYDGARFGYQRKLAPMHKLSYPTRLSWGGDGTLYVSDNQVNSVFIYDNTLQLAGELKNLDRPLGVIADAAGNIYVGNEGRKNVEVYDSMGNLLRTIGNGTVAMPNDMAIDRSNNLYVLDSATKRVLVYDESGNSLATIDGAASPWTGFSRSIAIAYSGPVGVAVGQLFIADSANSTIHVFSLDGAYKKSIGGPGSLYTTNWDGKFSGLSAVEIDMFGNVHGLDNNLNVVQVFEPLNGTFLRSYKAYPPANEYNLNLQTDFVIQPLDQRVIVSNLATRALETVATITAP